MQKIIELLNLRRDDDTDREGLKSEIFILNDKLKKREQEFNMTDDDDMIEALIYEQKALQARFTFLLKRARETGLEISFFDR
ncbi:MAG: DUF2508 family protein [Oscillospiraceae bacterium]|nr:DUF2508 family protein [Oscillospiraceae bacterium]